LLRDWALEEVSPMRRTEQQQREFSAAADSHMRTLQSVSRTMVVAKQMEQEVWQGSDAADLVRVQRTDAQRELSHVVQFSGMRGRSVLVRLLWWLQYTTSFLVPFMHTFYRGVFRNFLMAAFTANGAPDDPDRIMMPRAYRLPNAVRREMTARAARLVDTSDMARAIRDPARLSSYTMEELRTLCLVWLPLLWYGLVRSILTWCVATAICS
jgi:hypothetical protein